MKHYATVYLLLFFQVVWGQGEPLNEKVFPENEPTEMTSLYIESFGTIEKHRKLKAKARIGDFTGSCTIGLHGNSTLAADKKSYKIDFRNKKDSNSEVQLLNFASGREFILLANYYDQSFVRNALGFKLWEEMGHYVPKYIYCRLYLNNEYQGLYMLVEKIQADENHMNLGTNQREGHWFSDDPFLMKIDWENDGEVKGIGSVLTSSYYSSLAINSKLIYPKMVKESWKTFREIDTYLGTIDSQLRGNKFHDFRISIYQNEEVNGFDMASFVDYFLVNELSKNPDAYRSSAYFHRKKGGQLKMGPVWDFDLAFANTLNPDDNEHEGWIYTKELSKEELSTMPLWWYGLMCDSSFKSLCAERLNELDSLFSSEEIQVFIEELKNEIEEEVRMDVNRWGVHSEFELGVLGPLHPTFEERVKYIGDFYSARKSWIEQNVEVQPCISTYSITQKHKTMETYYADKSTGTAYVGFGFDAVPHSQGGRYNYDISYRYRVLNEDLVQMAEGSVWGKGALVNCADWPAGTYYFYLIMSGNETMLTYSAPAPYREYTMRLVVP